MSKICAIMMAMVLCISFTGCSKNSSSNDTPIIVGYWERANTDSNLYSMVIRIEQTDNGFVGKIIEIPDTARDAGFKTGETKLKNIQEAENTETDSKYESLKVYTMGDLTKNRLFKDISYYECRTWIDPENPDEFKLYPVKESDQEGWNHPLYRRIDYNK